MTKSQKLDHALMKMVDALSSVAEEVKLPDDLHTYKQVRAIEQQTAKKALKAFRDYQNHKDEPEA